MVLKADHNCVVDDLPCLKVLTYPETCQPVFPANRFIDKAIGKENNYVSDVSRKYAMFFLPTWT